MPEKDTLPQEPRRRFVATLIVTIEATTQDDAVDYAMTLWPTTTSPKGTVRACYVETVEAEEEP